MSADLERPLAKPAAHHAAAQTQAHPSMTTYLIAGVITFLITALELVIVYTDALAGVMKPLIVALLTINFAVAALYYQGLYYEDTASKVTFITGAVIGIIVAVSLPVLLQLGLIVR